MSGITICNIRNSRNEGKLVSNKKYPELKADRPHPRNYPHTPTDYRHTDNHLRLVMEGRYQVHYLPASLKLCGR